MAVSRQLAVMGPRILLPPNSNNSSLESKKPGKRWLLAFKSGIYVTEGSGRNKGYLVVVRYIIFSISGIVII